jgi:hypothetical protein
MTATSRRPARTRTPKAEAEAEAAGRIILGERLEELS